MGEQLTDNINDVYDRIKDDNTTRTKEIAVKNIDSDEYPATDTYVRVRLVPMIVYDDSKENIKAGIAGGAGMRLEDMKSDIPETPDFIHNMIQK